MGLYGPLVLTWWRCFLAFASCLLALAVFPVAARAAPGWLPAVDFANPAATSAAGQNPRVGVDAQGNSVAVWHRGPGTVPNDVVKAATRPAGGVWSPVEEISSEIVQVEAAPDVAVSAQGDAVAVWIGTGSPTSGGVVQAAVRPAAGSWSPPQDLSVAADSFRAKVAIDAQGNAVAVWERASASPFDENPYVVQVATRPAGGQWSEPLDLSQAKPSFGDAQVVVDPRGNAVVVWNGKPGSAHAVQAATRPPGGSWSKPQDLTTGPGNVESLKLAVGADGTAVAAWLRGSDPAKVVQAAIRAPGGGWGQQEEVGAADRGGGELAAAVDPNGNALVVWSYSSDGDNFVAHASARSAGGTWSSPPDELSSPSVTALKPTVAVDSAGNAIAVWVSYDDQPSFVYQAATRPAGGAWSSPQNVSSRISPGYSSAPQLAFDSQGNATAVWRLHQTLQAAGYDAAGPSLRGLQVPQAGTAGSPLAFTVSPLDVWSPVVSTSWSFGDGATATGTSVSHTYAAPGSYQVTATSTDSRGNPSSETHTVVISPAAAGGGMGNLVGGGAAPATGALPGSGVLRGPLRAEHSRAAALRRCLRRATGRRTARRRCLARYGRRPGRVRGLRARRLSATKVLLSFRAPASDGSHGPPARTYLIKQSNRPFSGSRGFRRARSLCGGSCRLSVGRVGQRVRVVINGLRPNTTYFYAVAARDNVSRRLGPRSRVVSATTR